jgi:hypothetical protein
MLNTPAPSDTAEAWTSPEYTSTRAPATLMAFSSTTRPAKETGSTAADCQARAAKPQISPTARMYTQF